MHHVGVHVQAQDASGHRGAFQGLVEAERHPKAGARRRRAEEGRAAARPDKLLAQ